MKRQTLSLGRQRRIVGNILAVGIEDAATCFALTLPEFDFAFFDIRSNSALPPADLLSIPVLFRVSVHKYAWSTGRWRNVGKVEVPPSLLAPRPMFIQDVLKSDSYEILVGGNTRAASREECEGLERCAVWDAEHVEDRLRDHFKGVPNKWVELLRIT